MVLAQKLIGTNVARCAASASSRAESRSELQRRLSENPATVGANRQMSPGFTAEVLHPALAGCEQIVRQWQSKNERAAELVFFARPRRTEGHRQGRLV